MDFKSTDSACIDSTQANFAYTNSEHMNAVVYVNFNRVSPTCVDPAHVNPVHVNSARRY